MASEWETAPLSELCEQIADCPHSTPLWTNSGVIVLRNQNIRGGRLDLSSPSYTDEEHFEQRSRRARLKAGDLVLTREAPMGEVCMVPENLRCCLGQRMVLLRPDPKKCDSRFLLYSIQSDAVQHEIKVNEGTGSTVSNLRIPLLEALPIPHPPLAEQKAIAAVLGALDDKIELNRRMNATLEAMARALFQSWFVDFDPVRAKMEGRQPAGMDAETAALFPHNFQDCSIGQIPSGWSVRDLGEIADFDKGLSYKGEGLADEGGVPMVNLGCFTGRGLFNADRVKRYTGEYRERHLVDAGDLVIANTDMTQNRVIIGSPALVPKLNGGKPFLFTHHVFAVRFKPSSEIWRRYVFFTLLKPEFREIAEGFSTGTTVLALPRDGLVNYSLCLPPVRLLEAFERQVESLLSAVDVNLHQSRTLSTLRDTLLPKLLSGELSLAGNEWLAEAASNL
jgi:type I restriction enzyme S subunit